MVFKTLEDGLILERLHDDYTISVIYVCEPKMITKQAGAGSWSKSLVNNLKSRDYQSEAKLTLSPKIAAIKTLVN